jgi:hypothetical protein
VSDHGFFLTLHAIRRQLAAMPNDLYLVRLIHSGTPKHCAGEHLWTAGLLTRATVVRFLRARNCDGYDVFLLPFAPHHHSGYIFLDLDRPAPHLLATMRAGGHQPCVVLQSSPGHLQAWIRVSADPLEPALATTIARHLARTYHADPASTDWRHLGRLAGFTNQKPQRRLPNGQPPWVRLLHAQPGLATHRASLLDAAQRQLPHQALPTSASDLPALDPPDPTLSSSVASALYQTWLRRLRIPQRFPQPDFSIADLWIAKELLRRRVPLAQLHAILRLGSPGFPRRHSHPDDYLRRTLARAALELRAAPFPCCPPPCGPIPHTRLRRANAAPHDTLAVSGSADTPHSNSTGGR